LNNSFLRISDYKRENFPCLNRKHINEELNGDIASNVNNAMIFLEKHIRIRYIERMKNAAREANVHAHYK